MYTVCSLVCLILFLSVHDVMADINANNIALIINLNDEQSVAVGEYYRQQRMIPQRNVIRVAFAAGRNVLTEQEFGVLKQQVELQVAADVQAYVLSWSKPFRVDCMSITSAFALGFDRKYCAEDCKATGRSAHFNSASDMPWRDQGIRPAMMLAGKSIASVKQLIDRGVAADYSREQGTAYLLSTSDVQRNVRASDFVNIQAAFGNLLPVQVVKSNVLKRKRDVLFYFTGLKQVAAINSNRFLPGAVADHLTSSGGVLFGSDQMSSIEWLEKGATGSYGTVVEPCNFPAKFPHPGVLMQHYLNGDTLLEAYWKSVAMPGQGVFIGEPLASPFKGCRIAMDNSGRFAWRTPLHSNHVLRASSNCGM